MDLPRTIAKVHQTSFIIVRTFLAFLHMKGYNVNIIDRFKVTKKMIIQVYVQTAHEWYEIQR